MNGEYAALAGRIREALTELELVAHRAEDLRDKAQLTGDDGYWDAVALNLHSFYTGVERIFTDTARTMEGSVPSSPSWHQDLLLQMSAEMSRLRPPVITRGTRDRLSEYLNFRHVVRNVYAFKMRFDRVQELAVGLRVCYEAVTRDLTNFAASLDQLARSDEAPTETSP